MSTNESPEIVETAPETPEESPQETTEEVPPGPKFSWEQKQSFKIVETMKNLINQTIDASTSEIDSLRKKLEKLTYGS
jgi:polyhydroxyalkanoate synthesis regulator phasin